MYWGCYRQLSSQGATFVDKVYFFSVPLTGVSISLACYVASITLSRA